MALVVADRVQETTTTTGTGTITLTGAVSGFQSFSVIGNANTTYYCVTSGSNWEVGIGTYTSAGTTLARTTILASSAAGAAITLAGTSNVFCVYPASKAVYEEADGSVILNVNSSTDALRITQTGAGNALVVEDSTNPDSTPFVVGADGNVGIGIVPVTGVNFYNVKNITGATSSRANFTVATVQSDATVAGDGYHTILSVVNSAFTLANLRYYVANQGTIGASAAVINQWGFYSGTGLIGATTNAGFYADNTAAVTAGKTAYGFYSNINTATGGGTAYGFYAAGTANNYFGGNVGIGTTLPTQKLDVNGNVAITGASRRILSDFSTAGSAGTVFQTSTVNGTTNVMAAPNGTGAYSNFVAYSSSDIANSGFLQMYHTAGNGWIGTNANGTGTGGYVAIAPSGGGSSTRAYFTTTGLGIGTNTPNSALEVAGGNIYVSGSGTFLSNVGANRSAISTVGLAAAGTTTTSASYAITTYDSAGTFILYVRSDGGLLVNGGKTESPAGTGATTASAANMFVASSAGTSQILRSTSSLRYKNSVADATYGLAEVMQLRPVTYKGNNDGDKIFGGFIAEEIDAIENIRSFVVYDEEGRADALAYGNMVSLLAKAMQEQQAMIEDLKARIAVLEAR